MVRFAASGAADAADMRAERGKHIIYFEDDDSGPALRALTPFLSWGTDDGKVIVDRDGYPKSLMGRGALRRL